MEAKQIFRPKVVDDVPEITPDEFRDYIGNVTLVDVRRPDEFNGELSHIVCRSGARGGMLLWNQKKYSTEGGIS